MSTAVKKPMTGPEARRVGRVGFSKDHRLATPRSALPKAVQSLLPKRGIYAAGGGLVSGAWRIVVDLDARTIFYGKSPRRNAPSFGPMPRHKKVKPVYEDLVEMVGLADRVWRAKHPAPARPSVDYDEIIILVDGPDAFFLQGFGPIRSVEGRALLKKIRAYGF